MVSSKTRGIVFNHIKYGDTSVVTTIYTELHGRKTFLVQGVYKRKSKFHSSFFQPLTLVNLEMNVKEGRDLQRIKELGLAQPFNSIPFNTAKIAIAIFISEVLYKCIREEENNQVLFDFLYNSIYLLDIFDRSIANFHIVFLLKLTKYLGFYPDNNYSPINNMFDTMNGRFYHHIFSKGDQFEEEVSYFLHQMLDQSFDSFNSIALTHNQRNGLLKKIIEFYSLHMQGLGEIKSLAILQSVFANE